MVVPSVVVHRMEGRASGLDGPYPRGSRCTGGNKEGQPGDVVSAVSDKNGLYLRFGIKYTIHIICTNTWKHFETL